MHGFHTGLLRAFLSAVTLTGLTDYTAFLSSRQQALPAETVLQEASSKLYSAPYCMPDDQQLELTVDEAVEFPVMRQ